MIASAGPTTCQQCRPLILKQFCPIDSFGFGQVGVLENDGKDSRNVCLRVRRTVIVIGF